MTDLQKEFVEISKQYEELKEKMKGLRESLREKMNELGVDSVFQDDNGTVYKIVTPTGTYVYYDPIAYNRTRREGEKTGSLSLKEAKELGFDVK
jgi:hypothetical protein